MSIFLLFQSCISRLDVCFDISGECMSQKNPPGPPRGPTDGFVRLPHILQRIPISKSLWWEWVASGYAPAAVKLSPKVTAWVASDIDEFIYRLSQNE